MKSILYSVCIGSLALALTAGGAEAAKDKRPERAKPQQRSAKVQAARPANTGRNMSAHRNVSAAQYRQRSYAKPRTSSASQSETCSCDALVAEDRRRGRRRHASYSSRTKRREERKDASAERAEEARVSCAT